MNNLSLKITQCNRAIVFLPMKIPTHYTRGVQYNISYSLFRSTSGNQILSHKSNLTVQLTSVLKQKIFPLWKTF